MTSWLSFGMCVGLIAAVVLAFYVTVVRQFVEPRIKPVKVKRVKPIEAKRADIGDPLWHARVRWHRFPSRHRKGVRS